MNRRIAISLLALSLACAPRTGNVPAIDPVADLAAVCTADSAWQAASIARSPERMRAFYAPNARADLPGPEPIRGVDAIADVLSQAYADTSLRLRVGWTMERAELVPGTTLAYTIGTWRRHTAAADSSGPYFAVWQKQADGRWLVLIDTGRFCAPSGAPQTSTKGSE